MICRASAGAVDSFSPATLHPIVVALSPQRTFWLALLWLGATQALSWSIAVTRVGLWPGNVAALTGSLLLVLTAVVGVVRPGWTGGPQSRTPVWWGSLIAAGAGTVGLLV